MMKCSCGGTLHVSRWFIERETKTDGYGGLIYTGRKRKAADSLVCNNCLREYPVDDTFDGEWKYSL